MRINNRKLRKLFWEVRRHAIILSIYAVCFLLAIYAICFVLSLPEIIVGLFCGF